MYPHDLSGPDRVSELCSQAKLACQAGFDGVMTSEHHGGFSGYLPNPLQVAGFLLCAIPVLNLAATPVLVIAGTLLALRLPEPASA